jgi:hypothetical protein
MYILADGGSLVPWANTVIAVLGLSAAAIALIHSRASNRTAREANDISRAANALAEEALDMQENEGRVRLVVKPRMACIVEDGEDPRPRPMVDIINLSAFPVTIRNIHWKTNRAEKAWLYWKNPTITSPFGELPARLPPHEALTALGTPTSFKSLDDVQAITAAVAFTACGEQIEGMTKEWQEDIASMLSQGA